MCGLPPSPPPPLTSQLPGFRFLLFPTLPHLAVVGSVTKTGEGSDFSKEMEKRGQGGEDSARQQGAHDLQAQPVRPRV